MNKFPDKKIIEEIAIELGVHASFIEKDWYATRALKTIGDITDKNFSPVFSGGTSLSKGYGLIERFSEDLDFKVVHPAGVTRPQLRAFREKVYTAFNGHSELKIIEDSKTSRDGSQFFACLIEYPKSFPPSESIRPHVQLEFSFRAPHFDPERREIRSFAAEFMKGDVDLQIECIQPLETAADKLNAFTWRVHARDREAEGDDPALIRHLHDLAKLEKTIQGKKAEFWRLANEIYTTDRKRTDTKMPETLIEAIENLVSILKKDKLYETEYTKFVTGVSYATEEKQVSFAQALAALKNIKISYKK